MVKAFQEYIEPEDGTPSSPRRATTSGEDEAVVLPLGENTLTHNFGIPVLIVCTKVNTLVFFFLGWPYFFILFFYTSCFKEFIKIVD